MMNRRAFTLLELVLATSVAAMLALALYSAMYTGFRARTSAGAQMNDIRVMTIAMDLIEQDLQSVPRPSGTLAGPFVGYAMGSPGREADSLTFYAIGRDLNADSPLSEGIRQVELVLKTDGQVPVLVRRVIRNLLAPVTPEPRDEVLVGNLSGFSIRYFDGSGWLTEWDSTLQEDALPVALEITLRKTSERNASTEPYTITRLIRLPCGAAASESADATGGG